MCFNTRTIYESDNVVFLSRLGLKSGDCYLIKYAFTQIKQGDKMSDTVSTCDRALYLRRRMGKPTICIGENKGANQLLGNREADQRLCFRYTDSTLPLLLKSEISSF